MAQRNLIPDPQVCERYGISPVTLWRWDQDATLDFPKPIRIKRRKYRYEDDLIEWERSRAAGRSTERNVNAAAA